MRSKAMFMALLALVFQALAEPVVSTDDVSAVAKGWVRDNAQGFGAQLGALQSVRPEKNADGETLFYWVIYEKGAVVIAPDTEIEPVIAMLPGCDGTLPEGHPMRALLLKDMTQRLGYAKSLAAQPAPKRTFQSAPPAPSRAAARWAELTRRGTASRSLQGVSVPNTVERPATIVKWLDGWNEEDDRIRCWNQDAPFNSYTPLSETPLGPFNSAVGCVATAGSSVLHYFRVPGCASNLVSKCTVDRREDEDHVVYGETNLVTIGGIYDWSLFDEVEEESSEGPIPEDLLEMLPPGWEDLSLDELKDIVRELLGEVELSPLDDLKARVSHDVGVLSHMSYSAGGSGAYGYDLATALRRHFGIESARYVNKNGPNGGNRASIPSDYYPALVYNQIRAGSPVIFGIDYSKTTQKVGHEVVACGYGIDTGNADYTFVFCGWGGDGDAWYSLPFIDTKASAGDGNVPYDTIGEMIVSLSTNACYVPLVGRVVDTDGLPVTNDLWLADGTLVHPDTNGYWGVRIDPNLPNKVIYDPVGEPHAFVVGVDAVTPQTYYGDGTKDAVAAATLAAALPDAMEIVVKREQIESGAKLEILGDYESAARRALAEGKLLYAFGGADEKAVAALKDDFRANSNETFFTSYVFWQVDANRYQTLGKSQFFAGAADPRTIDPYALWSVSNGLWTAGLEAWNLTNRFAVAGGLTLTGPSSINTSTDAAPGSYKYVLTVAYADGVTNVLNAALVDWSVDDADKGSISLGYLMPVKGATGPVKVTAAVPELFGVTGLSADLNVTLTDGPCVIVGGCRTNTCIIAEGGDVNVSNHVYEIAQGLVVPAFNKYGNDPLLEEKPFGSSITLEMQASRKFDGQYVLRCVGLEVVADDAVVTNVVFDATNASETVAYDYTVDGAVTHVGWKWKTDKYHVALGSEGNAKLDRETGYYPAGSNLVVNVLSGTGVTTNDAWVTVWSGCSRAEAGESCATVSVDRVRNVYAYAVNLSDENVTNRVNVSSTNALVVAKGYKIELVEVKGNPDWGEDLTYDIRVVRGDAPEPEWVDPDPIAFTSIEKVDGEWVLVATNATQWCEYALWSGTTVRTNEWTALGEADWDQWTEPFVTITNRVPVTEGEAQRFWIIRARPGLKPAE